MSACCLSTPAAASCEPTRLGGTRVGFPGAMVGFRTKPGMVARRRRRMSGLGASFWDTFSKEYTPGTLTKAFQAGYSGPAFVKQATEAPSFTLPYQPSAQDLDLGIFSGSTRMDAEGAATKAVAAIQSQDFDIPIPVLAPGGSLATSSGGISRNAVIGAAVVGLAVLVFFKMRGKAPKPAGA